MVMKNAFKVSKRIWQSQNESNYFFVKPVLLFTFKIVWLTLKTTYYKTQCERA
jgi:hypothetical protein